MEPSPIQTYRTKSRPEKLNKTRTITPFDPEPAAKLAKELLESIKAPFAVIGRIAVWAYLPPDVQEFTRDIDLAVPLECIASIEEQHKKRNIGYRPLVGSGQQIRRFISTSLIVDNIINNYSVKRLMKHKSNSQDQED